MWCLLILLVIWIDPFLLLIISLHSLCLHMLLSNTSQILFHGSVAKDLLSADDLLLHCVHLILFSFLLFHHFRFTDLHLSLQVDLVDLLLVEALKMIWLHSVSSKH